MRLSGIKSFLLYFLTVAFILWLGGFIYFANKIADMNANKNIKADGIVALTGGRNRIKEGIKELNRNNGELLFISGVAKHISLEQILKRNNVTGASKDKIVLDYKSFNTNENAVETAKWVNKKNYKSIKLITSSYHMPRSLLEFERAMPEVEIIPHPVHSDYVKREKWWTFSGTTGFIAVEYTKFLLIYTKLYIFNLEF